MSAKSHKKPVSVFSTKSFFMLHPWLSSFAAILIVLTFIRTFFALENADEVLNLGISWKMSLGMKPFYEVWELYQSGDMFLAPFLWLFYKVTGSTDGIVLFSRIINLAWNLVVGWIVYCGTKRFSGEFSFIAGLACVAFSSYGLYYLLYDTVGITMMLAGSALLLYALPIHNQRNGRMALIAAGAFHAWMAFAYPTFALTALIVYGLLLFLLYRETGKLKKSIFSSLFYVFGAAAVITCLGVYLLSYSKFSNILASLSDILSCPIWARDISISYGALSQVLVSILTLLKLLLLPTIGLFILFIFSLLKPHRNFLRLALCLGIIALPAIFSCWDPTFMRIGQLTPSYLFYLGLWAPALYFLINDRKSWFPIMLIGWLPSALSVFFVGTTAYSTEKGVLGLYSGGILTVLLLGAVIKQSLSQYTADDKLFASMLPHIVIVLFVPVLMLWQYYQFPFMHASVQQCNYTMPSGIYKGIKTIESNSGQTERQAIIEENRGTFQTVMYGSNLRNCYIMTDMKPFCPNVWSSYYYGESGAITWEYAYRYFEQMGDIPDMICIERWEISDLAPLLESDYFMTYQTDDSLGAIVVYAKKSLA